MSSQGARGGSSLFDFVDEASHKKAGIDQCVDEIYEYLDDASIFTAQEIYNAANESGGDTHVALAILQSAQERAQTPKKDNKGKKDTGKKDAGGEETFFDFHEEEDDKRKIIHVKTPMEMGALGELARGDSLHDTMLERSGRKASEKTPAPLASSASPSPLTSSSSPRASPSLFSSSSSSSVQKIKKQRGEAKTKDLQARFEKEKKDKDKEHLNLVVIGHVDAGKSTIMGHLLYLIGDVSNKELHRFKVDSENMGKGSFHFAWVLDQNAEERERGVTMDISVNYFDTEHKKVTLLDAPGHRDFVPRMIAGAAQADVAILVINASLGEFEKGFESDGQTKEHAVLARSLGITRLIVAINKLDLEGWSEERYREIEGKLSKYLLKEGFSQKNLAFLPCSGLTGENIKSFTANGGEWYKGPTLLEAIDEVPPIPRRVEKPFRMSISDVYSEISTGLTVTGKVESGFVMADDNLMIVPSKEIVKVKAVRILGDMVDFASAGTNVELSLKGVDISLLHVGAVLCDPENPIRTTRRFGATIQTFDLGQFGVIRPGHEVVVHLNNIVEAGCLGKRLMVHDLSDGGKGKGKNEPQQKRRAKILGSKQTASVRIDLKKPICLELFSEFRQLGRFTIRSEGRTVAAGIVTEIF
uniref:Tr-type G domain-containing protein n=1 Tax=Paramoeba aestuarina TaxID=180227 RepID=A0A7S4KQT6_9EUKA